MGLKNRFWFWSKLIIRNKQRVTLNTTGVQKVNMFDVLKYIPEFLILRQQLKIRGCGSISNRNNYHQIRWFVNGIYYVVLVVKVLENKHNTPVNNWNSPNKLFFNSVNYGSTYQIRVNNKSYRVWIIKLSSRSLTYVIAHLVSRHYILFLTMWTIQTLQNGTGELWTRSRNFSRIVLFIN